MNIETVDKCNTRKRERLDLDQFYLDQLHKIKSAPVSQLKTIREDHKAELEKLNSIIRGGDISDGLRSFLKGKRKMITFLLSDSRRQLKIFNLALNNRMTTPLARQFIKKAAENLRPTDFNRILSLCLTKKERLIYEMDKMKH